jgi:hypothetical protein
MKLLVIGDIHTKEEKAERICQKYKDHKIIFMADYFDDFGDTPEKNASTAAWLKESLKNPNRVHLKGNHDEIYDPRVGFMCSGFSSAKKAAINEVLTLEDWDKLKYFHHENNWWFSHAGLTKYWFAHPMGEPITEDRVQKIIDYSIIKQRMDNGDNAIWSPDEARGGSSPVGGILWCDWNRLDLIPDFRQVVGHTPCKRIIKIKDEIMKSEIINVDCSLDTHLWQVLEIDENGNTDVINTSYV